MLKRIAVCVFGGALSVMSLTGAAAAQISNSNAPVEVTAGRMEALRSEGRAIYTENVNAVQGETRILTDRLTIVCAQEETPPGQVETDDCEEIVQMIAEGNVFYTTPNERIRGDRAEYDYRTDTITVTGDVIMSRGTDGVIRGTRLVYNVTEGRATITAGTRPVQSIFTPTDNNDEPAAPARP
jgi:lipopolysaccharide export system protein LptA